MVTLRDIQKARDHVQEVAHYTPLDYSDSLSRWTGCDTYLKLENLQKTGSFKVRGAYQKIMSLTEDEKKKGVIAASAGNHAQGVALSATRAGIKSTVVMPEGAPLAKAEATRGYGAEVIFHGSSFDDAMAHARRIQQETGATFIHAFDDPYTIAGQGTVGLEIMEQLPDVGSIVCPIGGGGLIAGIALTAKTMNPDIKIWGVQAEGCASMAASLAGKCPVQIASSGTIADGIAVKRPGNMSFDLVRQYVDEVVVVSDLEIARAMLFLLERNKQLVEGSGAASVAALMFGKVDQPATEKTVAVVSGGNVDINLVSRIIERGLVEAGRYLTISTIVPDKPGYLNRLLNIISRLNANVISVHHHRIGTQIMPGQTVIELSLETRNAEHIEEIEHALDKEGYECNRLL